MNKGDAGLKESNCISTRRKFFLMGTTRDRGAKRRGAFRVGTDASLGANTRLAAKKGPLGGIRQISRGDCRRQSGGRHKIGENSKSEVNSI